MNGFALAFRLARRELRGGIRGFRIFLACLTIGVAAIAGVGSLGDSVVAGLRADARRLLGGDIDLRLHNRPADQQRLAYLKDNAESVSHVIDMRAMARAPGGGGVRALVELKAVDGSYPLVDTMALEPAMPLARALAAEGEAWGAVADSNLLTRLGVKIGDRLRVGEATVVVRATIVREPDRVASVFSLGPRLMVGMDALPATALVRPGSQAHFHYRVGLAAGTDGKAWTEDLKAAFPKAGWRIRGLDNATPGIQSFIERLAMFLTFAGLTALLVGGIGVGNAVNSYLDGKIATIATLKCLGAPGKLIFRTYLIHVLALGLVGIVLGLVIGAVAPAAGVWALSGLLPVEPRIGIFPGPLALAAVFGLLTALTFALWPLARARETPAAALFRDKVAPARRRPRRRYAVATVLGVAALAGLTVLTAEPRYFAWWFVGGAIATVVFLRMGAVALMAAAARVHRLPGAAWRLAVTNLHRPGTSTPSVVLSMGLGLSVLVAVALIEGNLRRLVDERLPETAPAFFFIDIQPDQVAAFDAAVTGIEGTSGLRRVPSLRGRIVEIDGVPVEKVDIATESRWAVRGDRALTYAAEAAADSRIVAGEWWPADYSGPPIISLDAGLAKGFGVDVGDTITVNVLGREIEPKITSLREIDWRSLRFDFAIIFAPGTLEGAPHSHLAAVQAPPAAEDALERAVTSRFSNVSAIRVRQVLEAAARILAGIGTAVRGTASITILAGALVLAGAIAAGQRRRVYDAVVFKVLGATRKTVLTAFVVEYGILGLATGAIAALIGTVTAWAVTVFLMRAEWVFLPGVVAMTAVACVAVSIALGFAGTWRALGQKAAPFLRNA